MKYGYICKLLALHEQNVRGQASTPHTRPKLATWRRATPQVKCHGECPTHQSMPAPWRRRTTPLHRSNILKLDTNPTHQAKCLEGGPIHPTHTGSSNLSGTCTIKKIHILTPRNRRPATSDVDMDAFLWGVCWVQWTLLQVNPLCHWKLHVRVADECFSGISNQSGFLGWCASQPQPKHGRCDHIFQRCELQSAVIALPEGQPWWQ